MAYSNENDEPLASCKSLPPPSPLVCQVAETGIKRPREVIEPCTVEPVEAPLRKLRSVQAQPTPFTDMLQHAGRAAGSLQQLSVVEQKLRQAVLDASPQPQLASSCHCEYLQQLYANEARSSPSATYMTHTQRHIDAAQRQVLVDWMVELADEFKLSQTALFMAVSLLDRFLSISCIPCTALQLAGTTCMWLAAKYEEVYPPDVHEFAEMTDGTYTYLELLQMEAKLLGCLGFDLSAPTTRLFLEAFSEQLHPLSSRALMLAEYLLELALLEYSCLQYRPSQLAAAALYLAQLTEVQAQGGSRTTRRSRPQQPAPAVRTVLPLQLVLPAVSALHHAHAWACQPSTRCAVKDKYAGGTLLRVAGLAPLQQLPDWH